MMSTEKRSWSTLAALVVLGAIWTASCGGESDDPIGGSTQRISCKTTADCKAVGGQCQANVCKADNECKSDADCTAGKVCVPNKSFGGLCGVKGSTPTPGPAWSCKADTDCPASQQCKAGTCVAPPSSPKPTAEICDNNKDDDGDGLTDCQDKDCEREPPCQKPPVTPTSTACNVLQQNCATSGYRCWPGGEYAKDGICFPAGPMKEGDPCQEPPVDGAKACGKGLVCAAADSTSTPICRVLCGSSADCKKTEACAKLNLGAGSTTKDYGVCVKAPAPPPPPPPVCDVFKQDCNASGDMCIPQKNTANTCVPKGSGAVGSYCVAPSDCAPTLMCAAHVGTSGSTLYYGFGYVRGGTCLPLCDPASPGCPAGTKCAPVLGNYGPRTDIGVCTK
jgi:hypothetical protein